VRKKEEKNIATKPSNVFLKEGTGSRKVFHKSKGRGTNVKSKKGGVKKEACEGGNGPPRTRGFFAGGEKRLGEPQANCEVQKLFSEKVLRCRIHTE